MVAPLGVLVLYEDLIAREMGCEIARQFAGKDDDDQFWLAAWDAALLEEPYFNPLITAQGASADLIVVALHDAGGFTQSIRCWINRWTAPDWQTARAIVVGRPTIVRPSTSCSG